MEKKVLQDTIDRVVNRLMNLGGADYDDDKIASDEEAQSGKIARDAGIEEWDWPQGVGIYGLMRLQRAGGDVHRFDSFLKEWFERNVEEGLPSKNINTTAPLLTLVDFCVQWEDPQYEELCIDRAEWLMNGLPKTREGGFQHVTTALGNRDGVTLNEGELWLDTLFMAVLFLARMGVKYDRMDWIEEAERQFLIHIKYLYEKKTGLFYHGWSFQRMDNFGGIFWCRGNSWFTFGIMDYIEDFGPDMDKGLKSYLIDTYRAQVDALIRVQAPSGLWHTVLLEDDSYEEVSGSAAIVTGILKGIRLGILDDSYLPAARRAVCAICENIAADGTVLNVSGGTGMGENAQHYKNIIIAPMAYGQSLTLVALCEALRSAA